LSKQLSVELIPAALPSLRASAWMRVCGIALAGSAFVAACAHLALPLSFTPVPLSMAPFAVLVLGLLLTPRLAAATLGAYLMEGALGLPVFAPTAGIGGLAHLLGPTGGYLLSYPLACFVVAMLLRRTTRGYSAAVLSAAAGSLVILFGGAMWLGVWTHIPASSLLTVTVLPFLPGDALKVAAAAALATGFRRLRRQTS
jgi:biotin transport system substrate-specific component